jgi:hypothetical protein
LIADMMSIYRVITGKEPATSVGAPLIRFLEAAGKPLKIAFSEGRRHRQDCLAVA